MTIRRLDFLIAGIQRAGTTALHAFLSTHPDIFLPQRKELHFFDQERKVDWTDPDYSRLHRWFEDRKEGQLAGEATPLYMYWKPSLARVRDYNPATKIIVLFRNPIERAYSHWGMQFSRGLETTPFSEAIREGRVRPNGRQKRGSSYIERGFYAEQVERLFALFPREQALLLRNDDLKHRHKETLDQICDFLGVQRFSTYPDAAGTGKDQTRADRVQASNVPPPSRDDVEYLAELYRRDLERTNELTALDLPLWTPSLGPEPITAMAGSASSEQTQQRL